MDEKISRWIVEFLVRQSVDDCIVENLLSTLPLRDDDFLLKKALLLRKVRAEVANAAVSEKVLDFLQHIADMEFGQGVITSETMKTAYCAVAVDCTVRFLEEEMENDGKYMGYLKRIWRGRVQKMETSENSVLVSENLRRWKNDLEAATSDAELRVKILSRNTRNEALKAVKYYLAEAWNDMGPTFLEKVVENEDKMEKVGQQDKGVQVSENDEFADSPPHSVPVSNEPEIDSNGGQTNAIDCHNMLLNKTGVEKGHVGVENAVEPQDGTVSSDKPAAMDGIVENDISVQEPIPRCDLAPKSLVNVVTPTSATRPSTGDGSSAAARPDGEQSLPLQGPSTETVKVSTVRYKHVPLRSRAKRHRPTKIVDLEEMDEDIPADKTNEIHPPEASGSHEGNDPKKAPFSDTLRAEPDEDILADKINEIHPPEASGSHEGHDPKKAPLSDTLRAEPDEDIPADKINEVHPPEASGSHEGHDPKKAPLSDTPRLEPSISARAEVQCTQVALASPREAQVVNTLVENDVGIQQKESTMKDVEGDGDGSKHCPGEEGPSSPGKATLVDKSPAAFKKEDLWESSAGVPSPKRRKAKRRWTPSEEDTLREGVKKFGKGNWKIILLAYRDAFQGRTEVDLKDKWRNLTK